MTAKTTPKIDENKRRIGEILLLDTIMEILEKFDQEHDYAEHSRRHQHHKKSRKNKSKKHRKNLSGSPYRDGSHAYNSGMALSRLQRIYHKHNATYYPPKESVSIVSANEITRRYLFSCNCTCNEKRCLVSMASDLEAFSR